MPDVDGEWQAVCERAQQVWTALRASKAKNVNSVHLKQSIRDIVQDHFRHMRPHLIGAGLDEEDFKVVDQSYQELLRLTHGNNARSSYQKWMKTIRAEAPNISSKLILPPAGTPAQSVRTTPQEDQIVTTLRQLVPTAALSYQQALADLQEDSRVSFRGPALELREAVRELLDHLAPDKIVMDTEGFKLEKDRSKPTFRQKVHFIMRARGRSRTAEAVPQDAIDTVEHGIGELARSIYNVGSLATHVSQSRRDVIQLKRYIDAILLDILAL